MYEHLEARAKYWPPPGLARQLTPMARPGPEGTARDAGLKPRLIDAPVRGSEVGFIDNYSSFTISGRETCSIFDIIYSQPMKTRGQADANQFVWTNALFLPVNIPIYGSPTQVIYLAPGGDDQGFQ